MNEIDQFIRFLQTEKKYSHHTCGAYRSDLVQALEYFALDFGPSVLLTELSFPILRNFIAALSSQGLSSRTINRKISSLRRFYTFYLVQGVISSHPLSNYKALKQSKSFSIPFSEEEIDSLFLAIDEEMAEETFEAVRDRLLLELLYLLGIRRSELIQITDKDLDLDAKQVRIQGKGQKQRLLPLSSNSIPIIERYLHSRYQRFQKPFFDSFLVTDKGDPLYPKFVYRKINSYLNEVSVKQKKSPHMIRHTFATHLLNRGADLNTVKELLGHSSLAATQVYTHSSIEELKSIYQSSHPRGKNTSS